MAGKLPTAEKLIEIRVVLREFDEMSARFEFIPSTDPALSALDAMEKRLIGYVREIVGE